ncbi:MAG: acetylxylan esterase [Planctomycetes bacterium]|nr:acetylxylan esterase [Planctomycetota bacterium]
MRSRFVWMLLCGFAVVPLVTASADDLPKNPMLFNPFVKQQATELREGDEAPRSMDEWQHRRAELKSHLLAAWGGFPDQPCNLEPRILGEFQRDGYRVEKLAFQTRPGIWMTANTYVPDKSGRLPAILMVHGHWAGAKQDPVVQSRCIAAAKLGFFVLCVDAFGAGERGLEKKLGEYHGEMVAATLFPVGLPLSGLQVYENMRAVDYLQTRPEVNPEQIGITGASGGGNQTMYAGAFDERFRCVVPTCSVGNYQAYLSAACCMCEVVPGALAFTEEGDVLGLSANRGLMVTSATQDAYQFSVDQARVSVARAAAIAALFKDASVKHTIIESPHAYNRAMREAMLGWMTKQLKGEGDGSPIEEPEVTPEDPEMLRCFPGDTRPDDFVTLPQFAATEARRLLAMRVIPKTVPEWSRAAQHGRTSLEDVFGGLPSAKPLNVKAERDADGKAEKLTFDSEPGLPLVLKRTVVESPARLAILLDLDSGADVAFAGNLATQLSAVGWAVAAVDLRATGSFAVQRDQIGRSPDHNSAEWSLWIGRPLLGQWTWDVKRTLDALQEKDGRLPAEILVVGIRSGGMVALCAGALDDRISRVVTINSLASYVTDQPYAGQRLGLMAPAIVREVGDVAHLAALMAPRPVVIAGGVTGSARPLGPVALKELFKFTEQIYALNVPDGESPFQISTPEDVLDLLK